ncbi:low specificity L-threonine aldolase [Verminephrobacter aporrectodeae subsp. tuberculatae]|uniref:GntG family PLP-dependent aldolase n=1 Tax=Verminephrobacter aporrectodeae TaxID=1110389 RepID=UPI0022448F43|nr:GntG family PLP-dependent aldolase [Verminephrobacter aporrectodeae]MCW8209275.1 low specificity L-threonine aldolase [Verminephrobacter aporrectodeae subsp. tuberculatae]
MTHGATLVANPAGKPPVDLRSDTVTRPTPAMYERMASAPLGDDGLDGDPTAQTLESSTAALLGKEAALYVPSATMANLLAILAQAERQELVLSEATSHIYVSERGAAALTGAFYESIAGIDGAMDLDLLGEALAPGLGRLRAGVVCLETSHNNAGGTVLPLEHMRAAFEASKRVGASVHLDGARLMNAAVALGVAAADIAAFADTVSLCLSKGLSAPMGAVLAGSAATIQRARSLRKMLGGSQRQVGIAAAAGLVAVSTMVERLADDHLAARRLAEGIGRIAGLVAKRPQTNIVQVDVGATGLDATQWESALRRLGVLVRPWGRKRLRCVTHRHVGAEEIDLALAGFTAVAERIA